MERSPGVGRSRWDATEKECSLIVRPPGLEQAPGKLGNFDARLLKSAAHIFGSQFISPLKRQSPSIYLFLANAGAFLLGPSLSGCPLSSLQDSCRLVGLRGRSTLSEVLGARGKGDNVAFIGKARIVYGASLQGVQSFVC